MSQVEDLEQQLEDTKKLVDTRQTTLRLFKNPDFRRIIIDGFMTHDCARFVQLSKDPSISKEAQQDSLELAIASGHLKRYLKMQVNMGAHAEHDLSALEEALEEARQEPDLADMAGPRNADGTPASTPIVENEGGLA